jgi:hypothetical protein
MLTSGSTGACTRVEVSASSSVGGQDARPGGASSTSSPTPGGNQCGSFSRLMPCLPARPPGHCQTDWRGGGGLAGKGSAPAPTNGAAVTLRSILHTSEIEAAEEQNPSTRCSWGLRNLSTARGTAQGSRRAAQLHSLD